MSRPSKEVETLARAMADRQEPRILLGRPVKISWKNRRILDAVTAHLARKRLVEHPDLFPNRLTRQQRRRLRLRGPHGG
jgi:hypothetical protein